MEHTGKRRTQFGIYALLLLGGLAGCRHKEPPPAPPAAIAPPPAAPAPITVITPLPSVPAVAGPNVQPAPPELPAPKPAPVKQTRRRRRTHPPAETAASGAAASTPATAQKDSASGLASTSAAPQNASQSGSQNLAASTPGASANAASAQEAAPALGELSTGTVISSVERSRLMSEIQALEGRLGKIGQPATKDALTVEMQVKTFLSRAREAVLENDLDGAHTLNTKALVLLDELKGD